MFARSATLKRRNWMAGCPACHFVSRRKGSDAGIINCRCAIRHKVLISGFVNFALGILLGGALRAHFVNVQSGRCRGEGHGAKTAIDPGYRVEGASWRANPLDAGSGLSQQLSDSDLSFFTTGLVARVTWFHGRCAQVDAGFAHGASFIDAVARAYGRSA